MASSAGGQGSLIGSTLGGYEVVALIGRGAMGSVYLARDQKLGRQVALKVLLGSLAKNPDSVKQFHQEAQAAAPLNHPGIVRIYSAGIESRTPYIAMEFVDGEPLDNFLKRKGRIDWDVALHIGGKIAQALDAAHRKGVVHSDIKPANIMLDKSGGIRLADFGIARIQSSGSGAASGTGFLGTPQYMSPEQATNKGVGPSSDLYSLGIVLFQMITGDLPFHGESSMALIKSICTDAAPRVDKTVPDIPDDVARFVAYFLEKDPKGRPANAKVAVEMITRLLRQKGDVSSYQSSLSSFLKDEMEIRPFSKVYDGTKKSGKGKNKPSNIGKKNIRPIPWLRISKIAGASIFLIISFLFGALNTPAIPVDLSSPPPLLSGSDHKRISNGLDLYALDTSGYSITGLRWNQNKKELLIEAGGKGNNSNRGKTGILTLDLNTGEWESLKSPQNPANGNSTIQPVLQSIRSHGNNSAFNQALPAVSHVPSKKSIVGVSLPSGRKFPNPEILWTIPESQWHRGEDRNGISVEPSTAILSPNGKRIALLLYDESDDYGFIAELSLEVDTGKRKTNRKTTVGNAISASSIRYSHDGGYISYVRKRATGDGELWLVPSGDNDNSGRRIASGIHEEGYSFNSSTTKVAIQKKSVGNSAPEIEIVSVRNGRIEKNLGFGEIGIRSWMAGNSALIINQLQVDGTYQWAKVDLDKNYEIEKLTQVSTGMSNTYVLSQDYSMLAGGVRNSETPSILVMDLN